MTILFVKNTNDFTHVDKYDGEEYVFPPQTKVQVPEEAAMHMFGYKCRDKSEALMRLGWANLPEGAGVRKLAGFVFTQGKIVDEDGKEVKMVVPTENNAARAIPEGVKMPRPDMQSRLAPVTG